MDASVTLQVPEHITVSKPNDDGGAYFYDAQIPVEWTNLNPDPDSFMVYVDDDYTTDPDGYSVTVAGSASTYQLPAKTIKVDQVNVTVGVNSTRTYTILGSGIATGSACSVMNASKSEGFDTKQ